MRREEPQWFPIRIIMSLFIVTSSAGDDIHICGTCKSQFIEIEAFLRHKRQGSCNGLPIPTPEGAVTTKIPTPNKNNVETADFDGQNDSQLQQTAKATTNKKVRNGKKFKCHYDDCPYASAYPKDLQRHLRVHTGERPYVCTICSKSFNRSDKFKAHERLHQGYKPYKCNECDYATSDGSSLKKHLRIHSDERPFRCQICQYASRNSSQLVVHLRTHTGDAPFECPTCQTKFKINSDLKRHLRMHTGERPYKCNLCNYSCAIKGNLKTHVRLNHSTDNIQHCTQCEFTSPSRKLLHQHEKTHAPKPLHCTYPECTYSCTSQASLRNHNRIHNSDRPFRCDFCPYTSRQPGNVRFHMKKKHPEKVPSNKKVVASKTPHSQTPNTTTSSLPSKTSDKNSDSRSVKQKQQQRSRPHCIRSFKCHLCEAAFVREDSLRCHVRQHKQLSEMREKSTTVQEVCSNAVEQRPLDGDRMIERALQQSGVTTTAEEEPSQNHNETLATVRATTSCEVSEQTEKLPTVLNQSHINQIPSTAQILYQVQPGFQFVPYKPPLEQSSTATVQYFLQTTDSGCPTPIFFNAPPPPPSVLGPCSSEPTSSTTATILHGSIDSIMPQPQLVNYVLSSSGQTCVTDPIGSLMTSGRTLLLSAGQVVAGNSQCSTVFVHPGNIVGTNSTTTEIVDGGIGGGGGGLSSVTIVQPSMPSSIVTSSSNLTVSTPSNCSTSLRHTILDEDIIMAQQNCLPIGNQPQIIHNK